MIVRHHLVSGPLDMRRMKSGIAMLMLMMAAASADAETVPMPAASYTPVISSDAFAAARFAARDRQVRIVRVQSAETVVETEANFRLCLHVRSGTKHFRAAAVILRAASGRFSLSQWNPGGC
jgi:hypothetical protein